MTKLIQVAKELNVGLSTLVEYLTNKGYEVENKPTAKITDEMHTELLKEFQKSIDIKERAKQINIGGRGKAGEGDNHDSDIFKVKPTAPQPAPTPEPQEATPEPELAAEEETPRIKLARPTVLGKIDLSGRLQQRAKGKDIKPAAVPAEKPTPEAPVSAPEPEPEPEKLVAKSLVVEEPIAPPVATPPPAAVPPTDTPQPTSTEKTGPDNFRAETPELRGLKILGKIDTDKFERKKKKKPAEPAAKPAAGTPAGTPKSSSADDADKKRKRKRKKVTVEGNNTNRPAGGGGGNDRAGQGPGGPPQRRPQGGGSGGGNRPGSNQRDDVKEVSKKEIEDQIKATMARLSGGGKRKRQKLQRDKRDRFRERQELIEQEQASGNLELTEFVSVQELANLLDVPVTDVITVCLNLGVIVSINQRLDAEIIELVANEFGHEVSFISVEELADDEVEEEDDPADLEPRAPIVTVMGHVDHGKTSLLDYIRSAKVASGEAGGITQHIGAYEVVLEGDRKITFLDTPGHEAFTAMRARGAKVTDIAIIIIAADDSIMPQTREAISHAQAAGVPIVFAINKIDKPGAQPEKIKQELASMNFLVEEWGGKYQSQDISAKTGVGIPELLEKILLEAELLEVKANPSRAAFGTVIEASLDKGRGYVTKLLVQNGSLAIGDSLVAGEYAGKVRAMLNERGKRVKEVGPSTPVLVLGLSGAPQAGDRFKVVDSDQEARQIASKRAQISREQANRATKRISLDEIGRRLALGSFKELNLIVKGDVDGSIEALSDSLIKLSIESVQVNVIHKAVGGIIESDVLLASASDAIIIGFQVRPSAGARKLAEKEGVEIKTYSIIYEAINEVKSAIEGMLEPTKQENITGQVEVREVYKISKIGTVAGCIVQEGKITRNNHVRLVRDGIVVFPTRENTHGEIASLKRFKDDVKEVRNGLECGISIKNFNDIKVGDIIEAYEITEIRQKLD